MPKVPDFERQQLHLSTTWLLVANAHIVVECISQQTGRLVDIIWCGRWHPTHIIDRQNGVLFNGFFSCMQLCRLWCCYRCRDHLTAVAARQIAPRGWHLCHVVVSSRSLFAAWPAALYDWTHECCDVNAYILWRSGMHEIQCMGRPR